MPTLPQNLRGEKEKFGVEQAFQPVRTGETPVPPADCHSEAASNRRTSNTRFFTPLRSVQNDMQKYFDKPMEQLIISTDH
jgi:hypothetical protein